MKQAIICYHSWSGNTKEVAELIESTLNEQGYSAELLEMSSASSAELIDCDFLFLGTFTWEKGNIPDEVLDFIEDFDLSDKEVAVFGTGDTQFGGDELFCKAVDRVTQRVNAKYIPLKIEQSPRGSQTNKVIKWTESVIEARNMKRSVLFVN